VSRSQSHIWLAIFDSKATYLRGLNLVRPIKLQTDIEMRQEGGLGPIGCWVDVAHVLIGIAAVSFFAVARARTRAIATDGSVLKSALRAPARWPPGSEPNLGPARLAESIRLGG
jgi:hypothetical protein